MSEVDLGSRHLRATREEGLLHVVIDRPERRNAFTMQMYNGMRRAAALADADPEIDVLLLTGSGDTFAVGGDMGGGSDETGTLGAEADPLDMLPFANLERCSKIVIAGVNGLCHAGGMDLMMSCDLSIAAASASFRAPELLRGAADGWLGARLPQRVGVARAKWLIFTAARIDAREAERIGLVSRVVPDAEFETALQEAVAAVRACAPQARAALKKQINQQLPPFDVEIFSRSIRSAEMVEGFQAFVEKRPPRWPRS